MDSKTHAKDLETLASELQNAGCIALLYDHELVERGNLLLNVYGGDVGAVETILRETEEVTVGDDSVAFFPELDPWGITTQGRRPLYIADEAAPAGEDGFPATPISDGVTELTAHLGGA